MWLRAIVLVGAGVGIAAAGSCSGTRPVARPASATNAPGDFRAITVRGLEGASTPLSVVLARRPTLVSLWAPWCEPCVREQPELERLSRAVRACGGAVVGVAVGEPPAAIAAFLHRGALTFPQYTDEPFELADAMGQRRIPATVVFDGAQRVVFAGDALNGKAIAALKTSLATLPGAQPCVMP
jgi:thiol-disulfide isomerase/thioredoxin